jgi:sugar O-acyltransferase (sialic acid O-acetyltransferase NeuD family)
MSKILAILGSGDLGQQIAHHAISDKHYYNVVFFDDYTSDNVRNGFQILGKTSDIEHEYENKSFDEIIIGLGYKYLNTKKELFERFQEKIPFGRIVHSSSWVDKSAIIEDGCVIYPSCSIDANSKIKANTVLNIGCTIAHDTTIEKHCFLSPRVAVAGFVKIEELCVIGINSTVIDNITIVAETQVGGGTVVINNIAFRGLHVGNPARFVRQ